MFEIFIVFAILKPEDFRITFIARTAPVDFSQRRFVSFCILSSAKEKSVFCWNDSDETPSEIEEIVLSIWSNEFYNFVKFWQKIKTPIYFLKMD